MIPIIAGVAPVPDLVPGTPATLYQLRTAAPSAVSQINGSDFPQDEILLSVDPNAEEVVIRVLDRQTHEVLDQFPSAQLLEFAAALTAQGQRNPVGPASLPTYA